MSKNSKNSIVKKSVDLIKKKSKVTQKMINSLSKPFLKNNLNQAIINKSL